MITIDSLKNMAKMSRFKAKRIRVKAARFDKKCRKEGSLGVTFVFNVCNKLEEMKGKYMETKFGGVRAGKREAIAKAVEKLGGRVMVTIKRSGGKLEAVSMTPEDAARHIRGNE